MPGAGGGERRSALFVQRNLELLGFGSHASALVQATKELFENGWDAVLVCVRAAHSASHNANALILTKRWTRPG